MQLSRPVMLVILDGWGCRVEVEDNAVVLASTPVFDHLMATCPNAQLSTSGGNVGLPHGQMGNSEVGHLNIGAGRVVMQELPRIDHAIESGELARNPAIAKLVARLRATNGVCHLAGLISPGGVHSHQRHALALAKILAAEGIKSIVHVMTDGRDTPPKSAAQYVADFSNELPSAARIGSLVGRFYAMDRDNRWQRVENGYAVIADAKGERFPTATAAIDASYKAGVTDEFIKPTVIGDYNGMRDGDAMLFFNFRSDRMREILAAFVDEDFKSFPRVRHVKASAILTMTQYDDVAKGVEVMFPPQKLTNTLGEFVAKQGLKQARMAETEKYPHVTFFLNGGIEQPNVGETRILVPSPKVDTYDLQPEMSAAELTDKAVATIASGEQDLIVLNFANPDMVGHTGSLPAAIKAVEAVDACLGRIVDAIAAQKGALLVIADHGNCELMRDPITGEPHTAHTTNPVPVILFGRGGAKISAGRLADVAPTLLNLMGLTQPVEMTGQSLIVPSA